MKEIQWAGAHTLRHEVKKKLNIFHDRPPITFTYVDTYTDFKQNHPLHIHQNVELYFCVSEHIDYVVEDAYYHLEPGDIIVIRPGEVHKVVLRESHQYERFFIVFPANSFPEHITNPLSPLLQAEGGSSRLRPPPELRDTVRTLLYDTLNICREDIPDGQSSLFQTKVYAKTLELLCTICECTAYVHGPDSHVNDSKLSTPLADVMLYIDRHLKTIQTVNEIAEAVHVSPSYLSALFRKHLGVPLVYHLQSLKISLAKQMLEEGYSVMDACRETGYTDCSYFIRVFKRHMGVTPLKYRAAFFAEEDAASAPVLDNAPYLSDKETPSKP